MVVTRLDGAPMFEPFRSKCTVLKKVLVTLLRLFGGLIVIRCPGNCAPLVTPLTGARSEVTGCKPRRA